MTKRKVKRNEFEFLKRELQYLEDSETIPRGKAKEIQELYRVEEKLSFTQTLLYVGSILIGVGILSFIASNWSEIGKTVKFLFILCLYLGCIFAGYKMEKSLPKTARSFYYLGVMVFGAGIFLIGQMFHFGGSFQGAFLWWSIGILPLAWVLRDKWILFVSALFTLIYMMDEPFLQGDRIPIWTILLIASIYVLNEKIGFSRAVGFVNGLQQLVFISTVITFFIGGDDESLYLYGLIYLVLGIALILRRARIRDVYVFLGHLIHGIAALMLSFENVWPSSIDWVYIPFSILYLIFVLYLVNRGSLFSIVILCGLIFRFYIDLSFDFLPKSLVFIIGGLLLLTFGFYFEKQRKKGGRVHE
ncbi:DUF2157 domain-containing protein [Neobacillus niacini]|uniref:DUF2157 domain-containing protein n=1 Tax=Neobacillus niacini TaxID=86668 RepID=UPI0028553C47|nr:DUF2157 domain-containing protein [Neobacillus niacini]MDR7001260.1 putative membrane protein [Neobacillus niacini]